MASWAYAARGAAAKSQTDRADFAADLLFGRLELIITERASRTPSRIRALRTQYPAGRQTPIFVPALNLTACAWLHGKTQL